MDLIYPEVTFTPEWKEGRDYERERIMKIIDNLPNLEKNVKELKFAILGAGEQQ